VGVEAWRQVEKGVKWHGTPDVLLTGTREQRVGFDEIGERVELQEWAEYHVRADDDASLEVYQGREPVEPLSPGVWRVVYQNYIGLGTLRFVLDGQELPPLLVEVRSNKFSSLAEQHTFYRALLNDLWQRNSRLPFTFKTPTVHAVDEAPQPPSPLFVYHFLHAYGDQLSAALETVLGTPHRVLYEEEALVTLPQASEVDADVIAWVVAHPEHWVRAPHLAVARHLDGHAPARVWQRLAEETFDTPPNRFVRHLMRQLTPWFAHPRLARYADDLATARGAVETAFHDPLFDEVGEMRRFPAESQVLLKRDGYRELLALWRLFHLARRPFFGPLEAAIDSRDVATLYEFWCFFRVVDELERLWGRATLELKVSDERGLEPKVQVRFEGSRYRLVYNRGFGRREDRSGSYSVLLRPDMTLLDGRRPLVALDAKFRLEATDWSPDADDTSARQAKRADLYKMHTYRDALQARAAVALYPGNKAEFFDLEQGQRRDVTLANLSRDDSWQGIGALPLRPGV
jgi:predicted component of viral defense system (DUF524 family)